MNQARLEWRVGLFVFVCLGLLAALLLNFAKGLTFFKPTYELLLRTSNVGGIKTKAAVLVAGVPVGTVRSIELSDDGHTVLIHLAIDKRFKIHGDAAFNIEAQGFLGDQYVSVEPTKNVLPPLVDGNVVTCREPFNIQEAARSALGLIQRMDQTVEQIREAVARIDRTVLAEKTLTNLTSTIENFRVVSEQTKSLTSRGTQIADKAASVVERLDLLIQTNAQPVTEAVNNLTGFSERMNGVAVELKSIVNDNRAEISAAVKNVESSSVILTNLLGDLQAGKGLVGGLLKDEKMKTDVLLLVSNYHTLGGNLSLLSSNLNIAAGNLNSNGLWRFLWKPKAPQTNTVPRTNVFPPYPGKRNSE